MSLKNRIIGLAAVSAAALAVAAPLASAATSTTTTTTSPCANLSYTPVFKAYLDVNNYFLAPDGGFEAGGAGWTLNGSSVVLDGGLPLTPAADARSLEIPAGATVTSPPICSNENTPTFRFMTKSRSLLSGWWSVSVSYLNKNGAKEKVTASRAPYFVWTPTPAIALKTNLIKTDATGWGSVQISITAPSNSALRIDDLYIDPRMH